MYFDVQKGTLVIFAVYISLFVIAISIVVYNAIIKYQNKRIAEYQNELMEKHCAEVENMYRRVRGWRHDYHSHIQSMKALLALGNTSELVKFLSKLDADLISVDTVIKTGNIMLDAILNSKLSMAKSLQIRTEINASVPAELNMTAIDLGVLIGNLLDNAIEACVKLKAPEGRFISTNIEVIKGELYIKVMNAYHEKQLKTDGNKLISNKGNGMHGFGLMRVDAVVAKHKGFVSRKAQNGIFTTEMMLPC